MPIGRAVLATMLVLFLAACDREGGRMLPDRNYVADARNGERLFGENCAGCHGPDALGSDRGPPLVNAIYRPAHHADLAFFWAVRDGVKQHHWQFGDMPPVPGLAPEAVADIVAYVRQAQRRRGIR